MLIVAVSREQRLQLFPVAFLFWAALGFDLSGRRAIKARESSGLVANSICFGMESQCNSQKRRPKLQKTTSMKLLHGQDHQFSPQVVPTTIPVVPVFRPCFLPRYDRGTACPTVVGATTFLTEWNTAPGKQTVCKHSASCHAQERTTPQERQPHTVRRCSVSQVSQVKSSQVKSSQVKSSQVKSSQVKSSQVKSSQVKSSQVKSSQVKSSQVKSSQSVKCSTVVAYAQTQCTRVTSRVCSRFSFRIVSAGQAAVCPQFFIARLSHPATRTSLPSCSSLMTHDGYWSFDFFFARHVLSPHLLFHHLFVA